MIFTIISIKIIKMSKAVVLLSCLVANLQIAMVFCQIPNPPDDLCIFGNTYDYDYDNYYWYDSVDDLYLTESQYNGIRKLNKQNVDSIVKENHLIRLRPYQIDAINAVKKSIEDGKKRFLLEMATGTGKTSTSMAIVKLFMQSLIMNQLI